MWKRNGRTGSDRPFTSRGDARIQMRMVLRSKIHNATVTEANLAYIGSITIDAKQNGTELTQATLPPAVAIAWLAELDEFVSNALQ
mgnify:CR=1 FL=1